MATVDPRIDWAITRMEEGLGGRLRIAEIARDVNLSRSQFTRLFRRIVGEPPAQYLHRRRLLRARVLIETTFLSIKEVMLQVGFNDPSHFTRDFVRLHGIAPSRVRTQPQPLEAAGSARSS